MQSVTVPLLLPSNQIPRKGYSPLKELRARFRHSIFIHATSVKPYAEKVQSLFRL